MHHSQTGRRAGIPITQDEEKRRALLRRLRHALTRRRYRHRRFA